MPTPSTVPLSSIRVLRLRLKDRHAAALGTMARDVNLVWNYSQELALKVFERERRFLSAFDIAKFTRGATKEGLNLHSQTVQAVSEEYVLRRKQFERIKLRWRVSGGTRRILGGLASKTGGARILPGVVRVTFWSALAMGVTSAIGALFGAVG